MPTCRLSAVITGCGGKEMTCSRRSIVARTRSTKGTSSARPGESVRLYRPSRSTTLAWACGTIVTLRARTRITNGAITMRVITAGGTRAVLRSWEMVRAADPAPSDTPGHYSGRRLTRKAVSAVADVGDGALDLHDPDLVADLEDLTVELGPRRPLVVAQPHPPRVLVHPLADHRGTPDVHRAAVDLLRSALDQVPFGDRPDDDEQRRRGQDEGQQLERDAEPHE